MLLEIDGLATKCNLGLNVNLVRYEIIIGMGAGAISQWMRELKFNLWT